MAFIALWIFLEDKKLMIPILSLKKMQATKCILLLGKHITEMAIFDFQISKTVCDNYM